MSLDFLSLAAIAGGPGAPVARSPMERSARAAGARFEVRDGWNVAVHYAPGSEAEHALCRRTAGWADVSHLGKLELQAPASQLDAIVADGGAGAELRLGVATWGTDAWWCRLTPSRALVLCAPHALAPLRTRLTAAAEATQRAAVVDVTSNFAALTLAGPQAREVFARFSALDLRSSSLPINGLRPGSIGRQPAVLIREAEDRFLFWFGWATGEYVWSVVADAAEHLGGGPIGVDALAQLPGPGGSDPTGDAEPWSA